MLRKNKNIDTNGVNEVITLGKKILKLMYILMIIAVILAVVIIGKEIGLVAFILAILKVISPLFIGFIVAWLFTPLANKIKQKGLSKVLSSTIVYLCLIAFLFIIIKVFIPIIYSQVNQFIGMIPSVLTKITDFINKVFADLSTSGIDLSTAKDTLLINLQTYGTNIASNLPANFINILVSLFSGIGIIALGLVIGFYMLIDFDNITTLFIKIIPRKNQMEVMKLLTDIGIEARKSVNGTLLVACMVFICDTVGFAIIGLDAALLFGLLCGITDLIPYIGPYIGMGVAAIVGFTQSPIIGIGVLIIAAIVQIVENYVLQPVVMSKATDLHPVVIMVGLLVFGYIFGIIGMILATPCLAILRVIYKFVIKKINDQKTKVIIEEV